MTDCAFFRNRYMQAHAKWTRACQRLEVVIEQQRDAVRTAESAGKLAWDQVVTARLEYEAAVERSVKPGGIKCNE